MNDSKYNIDLTNSNAGIIGDNATSNNTSQSILTGIHAEGDVNINIAGPVGQAINPEKQVKSNLPNNIIYRGSSHFVGREEELAAIDHNLKKSVIVAISAISGMGGVGKTELAIQYARRYQKDYPGGICWLSPRESALAEGIIQFVTSKMGLNVPQQIQGKTLTLEDQINWCWENWQPSQGLVLVILDDVTKLADCRSLLPKNNRFCLLLTTRVRNLDYQIKEIPLDVLKPEKALELLINIFGNEKVQKEAENARKLCAELGYLPLGLELMGAYIKNKLPQWTLAKMLEQLELKKIEDESLNPPQETLKGGLSTARRGVKAAFELSWEELKPQSMSQRVGELISLFAPNIFKWKWVERAGELLNWNSSDVEAANIQLYRQNLIQCIDEGEGLYQIHPLIREFLKIKLGELEEKDKLKQAFAEVFVSITETIPDSPTQNDIRLVEDAIPHLAEIAENLIDAVSNESLIWPFVGIGTYYEGQGLYKLAEPWYKQCVSLLETRLGEEHPDVATSYNNLAGLYYFQGRYSEAEPLYQKALALWQKLLGEEHPHVATSYNNLAALYDSQGRYSEAELLYQKALELRKKLLGEDHPDVAQSYNNLAYLYRAQGRYSEAELLYQKALELRKKLLGEDHPDVAQSYNNLAYLYRAQGRYSEAEPLYQKALELRKKLLGEDHPDVAQSYNNLARFYNFQGKYSEAEPLYQKALVIATRTLGENHPNTITIRKNLELLRNQLYGLLPSTSPRENIISQIWQRISRVFKQ
jgi:tetratricopeptide (TPR) repeat protein